MSARRGFAAAVGLSCLVVPPALADPVSSDRVAAVAFALTGSEGEVIRLDVRVLDRAQGDLVSVAQTECAAGRCWPTVHYEGELDQAADLDPDVARGSAQLDLGGQQLVVRWEPDERAAAVVGGLQAGGTGTTHVASTYVADAAVAEITWAGQTCTTGDAAVGTGVRAEVGDGSDSEHAARPLTDLRLPGGELRCAPGEKS